MTFENISFFSSSVSTTVSTDCCEYSILIRTTFLFPSTHNSLWQQQLEVSSRLRQNLSILNFLSSRLTTHAVRSLPCVCLLSLGLGFPGSSGNGPHFLSRSGVFWRVLCVHSPVRFTWSSLVFIITLLCRHNRHHCLGIREKVCKGYTAPSGLTSLV